jgi:general secretion pathway protein E/type IV pilus assembly protein PilB
MGISHEMMAGNIIGVIAQRLIRKLCPYCKIATIPTEKEKIMLEQGQDEQLEIYKAQGCHHCALTGYRGRIAIMELLHIDDEMNALIARRAYVDELGILAIKKGFISLGQDGLRKVLAGITSLDELMRVVNLTSRIS